MTAFNGTHKASAELMLQLQEHGKRRAKHEREDAQLTKELAKLTRRAQKRWGSYGSVTRVAELAKVSRATVHRALKATAKK